MELHRRHRDAAKCAEDVVEVAPQPVQELGKIPFGPHMGRVPGHEGRAVIAEREVYAAVTN